MNEKEHAHFKGKLQSSNVRPHARMRTDRRQAHQNIRNKRSFCKRKTYLFRNKYTVFVFLNIPNNRALTFAVGVAFIQKQRREPENEVDKRLERITQLANWISRWFNFWPIRAQTIQFVIFNSIHFDRCHEVYAISTLFRLVHTVCSSFSCILNQTIPPKMSVKDIYYSTRYSDDTGEFEYRWEL